MAASEDLTNAFHVVELDQLLFSFSLIVLPFRICRLGTSSFCPLKRMHNIPIFYQPV